MDRVVNLFACMSTTYSVLLAKISYKSGEARYGNCNKIERGRCSIDRKIIISKIVNRQLRKLLIPDLKVG